MEKKKVSSLKNLDMSELYYIFSLVFFFFLTHTMSFSPEVSNSVIQIFSELTLTRARSNDDTKKNSDKR